MKRRRARLIDANTIVMLKQIAWGILVILLAGLILTGIWHGTRLPSVTLGTVTVEGGETINQSTVVTMVKQQLAGEYIGFIPRAFAWTYPQKDIVNTLRQINRIYDISVQKKSGTELLVTFSEYLPEALWCKTLQTVECVFIDSSGLAYSSSPNLDGGSLLRFIHTSHEPKLGENLTTAEDFQLLKQLAKLLEENKWFVSHIELDKARDAFLHIVGGGEFKVTLNQDPQTTVDNLNVVLTSKEFSDIKPGNFQYIDLRFGNKVFVNEESASKDDAVALPEILEPSEEEMSTESATETAALEDAAGE